MTMGMMKINFNILCIINDDIMLRRLIVIFDTSI